MKAAENGSVFLAFCIVTGYTLTCVLRVPSGFLHTVTCGATQVCPSLRFTYKLCSRCKKEVIGYQ